MVNGERERERDGGKLGFSVYNGNFLIGCMWGPLNGEFCFVQDDHGVVIWSNQIRSDLTRAGS